MIHDLTKPELATIYTLEFEYVGPLGSIVRERVKAKARAGLTLDFWNKPLNELCKFAYGCQQKVWASNGNNSVTVTIVDRATA